MTRNEFIDNITEWYELKDFCSDFDCDVCEDNDDFEDYKEQALEWGDDYGVWEDEEEEDEEYADADDDFLDSLEEEPDEDETIEEEDFSIDDLIGMCSVVFVAIQNDEVEKQQEEDEAFAQLLSMDGRRIAT